MKSVKRKATSIPLEGWVDIQTYNFPNETNKARLMSLVIGGLWINAGSLRLKDVGASDASWRPL